MSNISYWEKLRSSKPVGKVNFLERKFEQMHQPWRTKRIKVHSGKHLFWHYCLQLSFVYKTVSQIYFNLFCSRHKRHGFVDERAMITLTLISSCHWKTLVPSCLRKKRPENAYLTLIVNYRKIEQKNKLCHPKQQKIGYFILYDVIY